MRAGNATSRIASVLSTRSDTTSSHAAGPAAPPRVDCGGAPGGGVPRSGVPRGAGVLSSCRCCAVAVDCGGAPGGGVPSSTFGTWASSSDCGFFARCSADAVASVDARASVALPSCPSACPVAAAAPRAGNIEGRLFWTLFNWPRAAAYDGAALLERTCSHARRTLNSLEYTAGDEGSGELSAWAHLTYARTRLSQYLSLFA